MTTWKRLFHAAAAVTAIAIVIAGFFWLHGRLFLGEKIALGFFVAIACAILVLTIPAALVPAARSWSRKAAMVVVASALLPSLVMLVELALDLRFRLAWKADNPAYTQEQRSIDIAATQVAATAGNGRPLGSQAMVQPVHSPHFNMNSAGFRAAEFQPAAAGRIRVVVLGGSTVFGAGVADDQTLPAQLQQLLDMRGAPVEVINLGINGATLREEIQALRWTYPMVRPDVAVFYHGGNNYSIGAALQDGAKASLVETNPLVTIGHHLAKETELGRLSSRLVAPLFGRPQPPADRIGHAVDIFLAQHQEARTLCAELKIACRFFLQPLLGDKTPMGTIEKRIAEDVELKFPGYHEGYGQFAKVSLAAIPEMVDLRATLNGVESTLFNDTIHLIGQGNRLMADAVLTHLSADLGQAAGKVP